MRVAIARGFRRVRALVLVASIGGIAGTNACGSSDSGGGASSAGVDQFISDYCSTLSGCCDSVGKTFDSNRCASSYRSEARGNVFDAAQATTCLDGLHAAKANGTLCDYRTSVRAPCSLVFRGSKQPGDSCIITVPVECAPSLEGTVTCFQSSAEKICMLSIDGKAGDSPCLFTKEGSSGHGSPWGGANPSRGYVCETKNGLLCNQTTKACVPASGIGAACDTTVDGYSCGIAGYCDRASATCVARPTAGGDCSAPGVRCALGTYCDTNIMKCATLLADGAPCTSQDSCAGGECLQGVCGGDNTGFLSVYCR